MSDWWLTSESSTVYTSVVLSRFDTGSSIVSTPVFFRKSELFLLRADCLWLKFARHPPSFFCSSLASHLSSFFSSSVASNSFYFLSTSSMLGFLCLHLQCYNHVGVGGHMYCQWYWCWYHIRNCYWHHQFFYQHLNCWYYHTHMRCLIQ